MLKSIDTPSRVRVTSGRQVALGEFQGNADKITVAEAPKNWGVYVSTVHIPSEAHTSQAVYEGQSVLTTFKADVLTKRMKTLTDQSNVNFKALVEAASSHFTGDRVQSRQQVLSSAELDILTHGDLAEEVD